MLTLQHFADRHKEWLKIVIYFGADSETAKEIVQQMYLKIGEIELKEGNLKRFINYNGAINTVWVFKVLQNLYIDSTKKKEYKSQIYIEYDEQPLDEQELEYHEILSKMQVVILSFNEYEQMLLELYFVHDRSLREISKRTGIGVHSIFNTIKNVKEKIKKNIESQYTEYRDSRNQTLVRLWGHDSETNTDDRD